MSVMPSNPEGGLSLEFNECNPVLNRARVWGQECGSPLPGMQSPLSAAASGSEASEVSDSRVTSVNPLHQLAMYYYVCGASSHRPLSGAPRHRNSHDESVFGSWSEFLASTFAVKLFFTSTNFLKGSHRVSFPIVRASSHAFILNLTYFSKKKKKKLQKNPGCAIAQLSRGLQTEG